MKSLEELWGPVLAPDAGGKKAAAPVYGIYKGHKYKILWQGTTRYGEKAHLQFTDGSKDFWVPLALVSGVPSVIPVSRITPQQLLKESPAGMKQQCEIGWPQSKCCPVCHSRHAYAPCGYPGCNPVYCDDCNGGGRYCRGGY